MSEHRVTWGYSDPGAIPTYFLPFFLNHLNYLFRVPIEDLSIIKDIKFNNHISSGKRKKIKNSILEYTF